MWYILLQFCRLVPNRFLRRYLLETHYTGTGHWAEIHCNFFFATKDLTGNSKLIYWILRAIPLTLHDGGNSTQRSSLRLLETEVVSSQLSRALNSLTSWKEPQDEHSVTLLVLPEKSLDTASTVRRLYTVQPLVKYSTLAVTISDGQDEVGIIWK